MATRSNTNGYEFKWIESGHDKIKEVFKVLYSNDEVVSLGIGGGGGGGKTFTGSAWAWTECFRYKGFHHAFCKIDIKNARRTLMETYKEFCRMYEIPLPWHGRYDRSFDGIIFPNNSKIYFIDLKRYPKKFPLADNLGGYPLNAAVVDDSPDVHDIVINKLYTRINRNPIIRENGELYNGKILETFNPHKGRVRSKFYLPYRNKKEVSHTRFIPMLVTEWLKHKEYFFDTGEIHKEDQGTWYGNYIKTLQASPYETQQRLLYGNFDYDDRPQAMFPFQYVQNCFSRASGVLPGFRILSVDPAYTGKDKMVMIITRGYDHVEYVIETDDKLYPDDVKARVLEVMHAFGIPASNVVYDAGGAGLHLRSIAGANAFNGARSPVETEKVTKKEKKEKAVKVYENLRTQCYYQLSYDIRDGLISFAPECEEHRLSFENDLNLWERTEIDNDKVFKMNSKGEAKSKNGGDSPDHSDALMQTRWLKMRSQVKGNKKYKPALA